MPFSASTTPGSSARAGTYKRKQPNVDRKFIIIGMDDSPRPEFSDEAMRCIGVAKVFSGGRRHRAIVAPMLPAHAEWIEIKAPMDEVFARYDAVFARGESEASTSIVVFASGDPLFFGIANTIRRRLPDAKLTLLPRFNSLQTLAHRLLMPYDDMRTVSLTGRPWAEFDKALIERSGKIGVLTDHVHTPAAIATRMIDYGYSYYTMYVGEHLGHPERECIRRLSPAEASGAEFAQPNCLLLRAEAEDGSPMPPPPRPFGIADNHFALLDGRSRMITKSAIRLLSLQAMDLGRRHTLWDIGFCTGSVSIEARLQFPHLNVVAFEIRPEGEELMSVNSRRHGAPGITTLIGDFLQADVHALPRPDAAFIGGHGGKLDNMISRVRGLLLPGGCIVFNSVSAESRLTFIRSAEANGLTLEPTVHIALDDYNPIDILKATLP